MEMMSEDPLHVGFTLMVQSNNTSDNTSDNTSTLHSDETATSVKSHLIASELTNGKSIMCSIAQRYDFTFMKQYWPVPGTVGL